ncbi:hypothetical protein HDE_04438 [Halotydeus destructor]|nr:hypothetical protein HDE_04438 [Halotydeus destructor]
MLPPLQNYIPVAAAEEVKQQIIVTSSNIHPSVYNGLPEDVYEWLDSFEMAATANAWSHQARLTKLPAYLNGSARQWFIEFRDNVLNKLDGLDEEKWAKTVADLQTSFGAQNTSVVNCNSMMKRKQESGEDAMTYYLAKISLIRRYNPLMSEKEKVDQVINGLSGTLFDKIYPYECKNLEDLRKKIQLHAEGHKLAIERSDFSTSALVEATAEKIGETVCNAVMTKMSETKPNLSPNYGDRVDSNRTRYEAGRGRSFNNMRGRGRGRGRTNDRGELVCNHCGLVGHLWRACRKRLNEERNRNAQYFTENQGRSQNRQYQRDQQ